MNIGDLVTLAKDAERIPAIVVALYKDVHDDIVADLHAFTTTHVAIPTVQQDNPDALRVLPGPPQDNQPPQTAVAGPSTAETADKATIADLQSKLAAAEAQLAADTKADGTPS